jgi:hypothetical protein
MDSHQLFRRLNGDHTEIMGWAAMERNMLWDRKLSLGQGAVNEINIILWEALKAVSSLDAMPPI